jgi:3',5'-cyclic AMP phosphodiesterase CpdA
MRTGGGALCAERRDWLAAQLEDARDRDVVIAMHHPPFATGIPFMDAGGLVSGDAAALAAIVERHPNVQRVICGHLHRPIHARFAGTIASTAPSCAHQVELTFDPAAPAAFTFEPPALALHALTASGLVSHQLYIDRFDGPYRF